MHRARRATSADLEDIPEHLRDELDFVFVDEIGEVLEAALEPDASTASALACTGEAGYRLAVRTASDVGGRAMAAKKKAAKARSAAAARANPYVQRVIEDDELRDERRECLRERPEGLRPADQRQAGDEGPRRQEAAEGPQAGGRVAARRRRRRCARGPRRRSAAAASAKLLLVGIVGAGVALALSEGLRKKVLDALFGAEEEFDYTSTTSPAPAGETVSSGS